MGLGLAQTRLAMRGHHVIKRIDSSGCFLKLCCKFWAFKLRAVVPILI